uniref:Integrase catalytic domain-containing protein n=1 Tax=Chara braunii TaxID=69332 RepID=A0A388L2F1_CHABU
MIAYYVLPILMRSSLISRFALDTQVSADTRLEGLISRRQSGSAASPDPAAAAAAAAASGGAGTSGTVAAPGPDPAMVGPGNNFAYLDRKAAEISSKYDGKDDVESWINTMRSYFDVLGTPPVTQSSVLGTNVEPAVRGFLEIQVVQAGYKRIDLNKWLKATPVATLEDLLIQQYADPHAAAKARLKLDKLKHNKWTGTMQSLQQYVSKLFATPNLEITAQSCLDVIKATVPSAEIRRLGLKLAEYTNWLSLMRDIVKLEAQDLLGGSSGKRALGRKRFFGSNRLAAHDLLEDDEEILADNPSFDDHQEQGCEASCSSSAHESELVNDEESMNAFKKTAFKNKGPRTTMKNNTNTILLPKGAKIPPKPEDPATKSWVDFRISENSSLDSDPTQQTSPETPSDADSKAEKIHILYQEPWVEPEEIDFHALLTRWAHMKQERAQGRMKLIFFKLYINGRYIRVLADCGATANYFSPHGIRKALLGMKQVTLQNPCRTQVGNQEVVTSTHAVKGVRTTFDADRIITHELNFYVLDQCPFDAVIGLGWLQAQCERTTWKYSQFMVKDATGIERPVLLDEPREFVAECEVCQRIKPSRQKPYGLLHPLPIPDGPGESVSIDFTDMGKKSRNGYSQVMVIVDRFSKFLNLIPLPPHAPTDLVIKEFHKRYILQCGPPKTLVSDQDTRFISAEWKDFTSQVYDMKLKMTSSRHPEGNGLAEEINQTVIQLLRALIVPDQNSWDEELPNVQGLYNNSIHSSTGMTPNRLHLGWKIRNPLSYLFPEQPRGLTPGQPGYSAKYDRLLKVAVAAMERRRSAMIKHANKKRQPTPFTVGSYVWVKMSEFSEEEGVSRKLLPQYYGPWKVLNQIHDKAQWLLQCESQVPYGIAGKVSNDSALKRQCDRYMTDNEGVRWTHNELLGMLNKKEAEVTALRSAFTKIEVNARSVLESFLERKRSEEVRDCSLSSSVDAKKEDDVGEDIASQLRFLIQSSIRKYLLDQIAELSTKVDPHVSKEYLPPEALNGRKLVINPDAIPDGEHARRYNRPMVLHEMCVLMVDELLPLEFEIRLRTPLPGEWQTVVVPKCSRAHDCLSDSRMSHKYDTRAKRKAMTTNNTTQYDTNVTSKAEAEDSETSKKSGSDERSVNLGSEHPRDDHPVVGEVERGCSQGNTLDDAEKMVVEGDGDDCRADGDGSCRGLHNVIPLRAALWKSIRQLKLVNCTTGHKWHREWGFQVEEVEKWGEVEEEFIMTGLTIELLLKLFNLKKFDFTKIDIEGSEKELFTRSETNSLKWMNNTALFMVEVHNSMRAGAQAAVDGIFRAGDGKFKLLKDYGMFQAWTNAALSDPKMRENNIL